MDTGAIEDGLHGAALLKTGRQTDGRLDGTIPSLVEGGGLLRIVQQEGRFYCIIHTC